LHEVPRTEEAEGFERERRRVEQLLGGEQGGEGESAERV
jgi:hypothetical protein